MVTAIYAGAVGLLYAAKGLFSKKASAPAMPAPVPAGNGLSTGSILSMALLLFVVFLVLRGVRPLLD